MGRTDRELRQAIQGLSGVQFEYLVADLWELQGYESRVTKPTSDQGVDVIATNPDDNRRVLIQAKCNSEGNAVGVNDVRNFLGAPIPGDERVFVTTSEFTTDAKAAAFDTERKISLLNGDEVVRLIRETQSEALLKEYTEAGDAIPTQQKLEEFQNGEGGSTNALAEDETVQSKNDGSDTWVNRAIGAITIGAILTFAISEASLIFTEQGWIVLVPLFLVWFYPPYAIYRDAREQGHSYIPSLIWPLLSFVALIPGIYYLYRRKVQ